MAMPYSARSYLYRLVPMVLGVWRKVASKIIASY